MRPAPVTAFTDGVRGARRIRGKSDEGNFILILPVGAFGLDMMRREMFLFMTSGSSPHLSAWWVSVCHSQVHTSLHSRVLLAHFNMENLM